MKRILIPTDFSAVADNALAYAIEIAAAFKSEIYLYHAYYIDRVDYKMDLSADDQRRERGFFKNLFQKSITKTQVYANSIPLLVLPEG